MSALRSPAERIANGRRRDRSCCSSDSGADGRLCRAAQDKAPARPSLPEGGNVGLRGEMVKHRHLGPAFVFHIVGILTMLRAVPFALYGKDRTLSVAHAAVIGDWWKRTDPATTAELKFIKRARDLALKEGALNSIAVASAQIFDWFEAQLNEIEANLPDD